MSNLTMNHALILDALADDGESLVQIKNFFIVVKIEVTEDELKNLILELLKMNYIYIRFPVGASIEDLLASYNHNFEDFWFEQTKEGRAYWETVSF